jgi:hypothetical protein
VHGPCAGRELQSKGCPFRSGQNSLPRRSAAQLQLLPVSLSITHSYDPPHSPPLRPYRPQQLRVPATAALGVPTAHGGHPTRQHALSIPLRRAASLERHVTIRIHAADTVAGFTGPNDDARRRPDDARLHGYMRTRPGRPSLLPPQESSTAI